MRTIFAVLALCFALAAPAGATQSDPRLPELFHRLLASSDPAEARTIEGQIWQLWIASDDPAASREMQAGIQAMQAGLFPLALQSFDRLIARAPDHAEAWNKRATLYYLVGDLEASVRDVQKTLALEPRHFGAWSGLGLIYAALDRPEAALKAFEAALKINPHLPGAIANIEEMKRRIRGDRT